MSFDRIMGLVRRVTRRATDTDTPSVQVQLESMADEPHRDVEVLETYGFTAHPPATVPEGIAIFVGGNADHGIVLGWLDKSHRPQGLKEGETESYSVHGQSLRYNDKGEVILKAVQHGQSLTFNDQGEVEIVAQAGQRVLLDRMGQVVIKDQAGSTFSMLASGDVEVTPKSAIFRINGLLTAASGGSSISMTEAGDIVMTPASGVVRTVGNAHATQDVVAMEGGRNISLNAHDHEGVASGGDHSGGPV